MKLGPYCTNADMTLEELSGLKADDPTNAPTYMVKTVLGAWKKPLSKLNTEEVWFLVSQQVGLPYILDLIWPILQDNPLYYFDKYEGDVLSVLLRAPESAWIKRPEYQAELADLKRRALLAPSSINDMFCESLTQ